MAKKKKVVKKDKLTRAERSKINKAKHAETQARQAGARAREKEKETTEAPKIIPYPQAGAKVIEFEKELDRQLGPESTGVEGTTGTSPGEAAGPAQFDLTVIAQVCQIPFDLWSISQGVDQLKLTDKEARLMAKPAKQLLDYYLPQIPVIAWAWISLTVVSYGALKTRLLLIQELKKRSLPSEPAAEARGTSASNSSPRPQGHGGPPPPGISPFPTIDQIKKPAS